MIVPALFCDTKFNRNDIDKHRIGQLHALAPKMLTDMKHKAIATALYLGIFEQWRVSAAIRVGASCDQELWLRIERIQFDRNVSRRAAMYRIEDMCREFTHVD